MSTQAKVGIFTLLTLIGVFATYYFITNFALRHSGYQIGVHFHDVGGLQEGSSVLLSGVQIGEVTAVQLLPDETVEVICTINPGNVIYRDSVFTVAITITGATTLTIKPPAVHEVAMVLPEKPLPIEQQPWGGLPPSLTDLVSAGQDQLKQLEKTLAVVNKALPALLGKFTDVANDTDHLIAHTDRTLAGL
jgi:ABC-type transporter Mla subunit MlaD